MTAHLISPGSGRANFAMFLANVSAGGAAPPAPAPEVERCAPAQQLGRCRCQGGASSPSLGRCERRRFVLVLEGEAAVTHEDGRQDVLGSNSYAYFPPGSAARLSTSSGVGLVVWERKYSLPQVSACGPAGPVAARDPRSVPQATPPLVWRCATCRERKRWGAEAGDALPPRTGARRASLCTRRATWTTRRCCLLLGRCLSCASCCPRCGAPADGRVCARVWSRCAPCAVRCEPATMLHRCRRCADGGLRLQHPHHGL